jgi:hypothetical protein
MHLFQGIKIGTRYYLALGLGPWALGLAAYTVTALLIISSPCDSEAKKPILKMCS